MGTLGDDKCIVCFLWIENKTFFFLFWLLFSQKYLKLFICLNTWHFGLNNEIRVNVTQILDSNINKKQKFIYSVNIDNI